MQNVAAKVAKGSVWVVAARGLTNALAFISTIVLARVLVPADFGLVAIGTTILAITNAVTNLSLAQALLQHRAPTEEHMHAVWTLGVLRGLAVALGFSATAGLVADFFGDERLALVMHALGFSVFLSGLANPRRIMLQKDLVFWQDFVVNVVQKLVGVAASVAVALIYRSYWALILGLIASQVAGVIVSYMFLPFRPRPTVKHFRELWSFSIWLTLGQVVSTINWRFDQLLVGKLLGRVELGYYNVGGNLALMPTREATQPLLQTLYPAFSRVRDAPDRLRAAYQRSQAFVTAIALPLGVGTALVARPLVELAMGAKWLPAVVVIETLASVVALTTLGSLAQPLGMALGQTKLLFWREVQIFLIRVPIITGALYLGGLPGILAARAVTSVIAIGFNLVLVRRLAGLPVLTQLRANARCLLATGGMVAAVIVAKRLAPVHEHPNLIGQVAMIAIVGASAYVGISLLLWLAMRRPQGPEVEVVRLVQAVLGRKRRAAAS